MAWVVISTGHKHGPQELIVDHQTTLIQDSMQIICAVHVEVETAPYFRVLSLKVLNFTGRFSPLNTQPLTVQPNTMNGNSQLLSLVGILRLL